MHVCLDERITSLGVAGRMKAKAKLVMGLSSRPNYNELSVQRLINLLENTQKNVQQAIDI